MNISDIQTRVIDEVRLIPQNKLLELYSFIHFYRLGLEKIQTNTEDIMQFAGSWEEMQDEEFDKFSEDIAERRKTAYSKFCNNFW
ncbi:MAG: hypothetical protein HQK63_16390 [Desulfamplus sp.]|nr:hypothetical protein [Desulfamplus sp.]